ncbi:M1 family metallopeptidase [Chryseobacterium sp. A301]
MRILTFLLSISCALLSAQTFTRQDTLKGSNTEFRDFWDVKKYDIVVKPTFETQTLEGQNTITFEVTEDRKNTTLQIDLQSPMNYKILKHNLGLISEKREGDFLFLTPKLPLKKGQRYALTIGYSGAPKIAKKAPWDGGWVFAKDKKNRPFMSVAQEGEGPSLWLPLKDQWLDEPDEGMTMEIVTPSDLVGVGNGRLVSKTQKGDFTSYIWEVKNPINGYSMVPSIGHYVHFGESYEGEKGPLDLDYWVLDYNLEKAKKQFAQVKPMMKAFEYWFGPYPFYEDSYKLVETPYLGMEHQSNVAYGNNYENGYLGRDLSQTGVGLKWDFIIIHETGHEWFANNITASEKADMWIQEAFTSYSETLFTENYLDPISADRYQIGTRRAIQNDKPIIGLYGVNVSGSGDMYYKGASMLHTIREAVNDDAKFRHMLRALNKTFYHQMVSSAQIENEMSKLLDRDLSSVFNQYLRGVKVPKLELVHNPDQGTLEFRFQNTVPNFSLPIHLNKNRTIHPTALWQSIKLSKGETFEVSPNYYIEVDLKTS